VGGTERLKPAAALPDRWNDASGGLGYHWRAWRYRRRLWSGFHAQVARWLEAWPTRARTLVLVGPSAGYALRPAFLQRFERLIAIEPDPLARMLLRHRFRDFGWQFMREDVFADEAALAGVSARYPDAAVLFCNVIGQVLDADGLARWRSAQAAWFEAHDWASWHDVFSSGQRPRALPGAVEAPLGPAASAEVARRLWAGIGCQVEDHGSFGQWPGADHVLWQLTPTQWHVVGWVAHVATTGQ
jgi:hypothetical protein